MIDNDKTVSCLVCGKEMTISKSAKSGVCANCMADGSFSKWRRGENKNKGEKMEDKKKEEDKVQEVIGEVEDVEEEVGYVEETEKKGEIVNEEAPAKDIKSPKEKGFSRRSLIKDFLLKGLHPVEVLAEVSKALPNDDPKKIKAHISTLKCLLKREGLLKKDEGVLLSNKGKNDNQSEESN